MAWDIWMRWCGWKAAWRSDGHWRWRPGPPRCTADSWPLDLDRRQTEVAASPRGTATAAGMHLQVLRCRRPRS